MYLGVVEIFHKDDIEQGLDGGHMETFCCATENQAQMLIEQMSDFQDEDEPDKWFAKSAYMPAHAIFLGDPMDAVSPDKSPGVFLNRPSQLPETAKDFVRLGKVSVDLISELKKETEAVWEK